MTTASAHLCRVSARCTGSVRSREMPEGRDGVVRTSLSTTLSSLLLGGPQDPMPQYVTLTFRQNRALPLAFAMSVPDDDCALG